MWFPAGFRWSGCRNVCEDEGRSSGLRAWKLRLRWVFFGMGILASSVQSCILRAPYRRPQMPKGTKLYYGWVSQNERLMSKVKFSKHGCWGWRGCLNNKGYPTFFAIENGERKNRYAHRLLWELANGKKIPEGLEMDHLCKNPACVRPSHLEPVTGAENNLRSNSPTSKNAKKRFCIRGHEFSKENTYFRPDGHGRACIKCCAFRAKRTSIRNGR